MRFLAPLFLIVPFVLAGCAGEDAATRDTTPNAAAGTYSLVAINGEDLPVYVGSYEGCDEYAQSGTLELQPDGRYEFWATMREDCAESEELESGTSREGETGTFSVDQTAEDWTIQLMEEAREQAALNRWEDAGSDAGRDIPIEDLGGTGRYDGTMLTVQLKQGEGTATFRRN